MSGAMVLRMLSASIGHQPLSSVSPACCAIWSANLLGMLWPEPDAAFVVPVGGRDPPVAG